MTNLEIPSEIIKRFSENDCLDFAVGLSKISNWPIKLLYRQDMTSHDRKRWVWRWIPTHVFCVTPNGKYADIKGIHQPLDFIYQ